MLVVIHVYYGRAPDMSNDAHYCAVGKKIHSQILALHTSSASKNLRMTLPMILMPTSMSSMVDEA